MAFHDMKDHKELLNNSFPSDIKSRKKIVDSITDKILKSGKRIVLTGEELYLTIDEAVTNAMEHGNKWDPLKKLHVRITSNSNHLHVVISDEGNGFNTRKIEKGIRKRDVLSTRGRGIYIINQFCDIKWNDKGNQIDLQLKIDQ
jgi:serine/threonine-protein kinase RsbW